MMPHFFLGTILACSTAGHPSVNQEFVQLLQNKEKQSRESVVLRQQQKQQWLEKAKYQWNETRLQQCPTDSSPSCISFMRDFISTFEFAMVSLKYKPQSTIIRNIHIPISAVQEAKAWRKKHDPKWRDEVNVHKRYTMVRIPGDIFVMGCQPGDSHCDEDELPPHIVTIQHDFYLGKTEVTQELYTHIQNQNPSRFQYCGALCPIESISFYEAITFLNQLSQKDGLMKCYTGTGKNMSFVGVECTGYRLPTEAEWEHAARGGESFLYAGSNSVDEVAWYEKNAGDTTHPVAQKKPNGFGLFDMSGNVMEWCNDWYWQYTAAAKTDPVQQTRTKSKVGRGGTWFEDHAKTRNSDRYFEDPTFQYDLLGFRIAQTIMAPQTPDSP